MAIENCKYFFTIFLLIVMLIACKKEEEIGFEVHPSSDKIIVGYNDTAGIVAYSVFEDSIKTDETVLNLLGSYKDDIFGTNNAGFYFQIRMPDNDLNFGGMAQADSVVLCLAYNGYFGDISTSLEINVFEILEDFYIDSNYYSNSSLDVSASDLCDVVFVPAPEDSVSVDGEILGPHLRLRLNNSIGQKILDASATSDLSDNTNFLNFFKGLYIEAEPVASDGSLLYFNLISALSKLTIYYHNATEDSLKYDFVINENSARFNTFYHNSYAGADMSFLNQVNGDTTLGNSTLYVQALSGVKTFIRFYGLKELFPGKTPVINKAELVIPVDEILQGDFIKPDKLTLVKIDGNGTNEFLPDETLYGSSYFGGSYNSTTKEYRFNIATYIQNLLKDESSSEQGLYLMISGAATKGDRLVINGTGSLVSNLHLEIIYTLVN